MLDEFDRQAMREANALNRQGRTKQANYNRIRQATNYNEARIDAILLVERARINRDFHKN